MKASYIAQLCEHTSSLIQMQKQLLAAFKEQRPRTEINALKKELADLYRVMKETRMSTL